MGMSDLSDTASRERLKYMFKRYAASTGFGLAATALSVSGLYFGACAFESANSHENVMVRSENEQADGPAAVFNRSINELDSNIFIYGGVAAMSFLIAAGAGLKSREYFSRGEAHRKWQHQYS